MPDARSRPHMQVPGQRAIPPLPAGDHLHRGAGAEQNAIDRVCVRLYPWHILRNPD